MKKILSIMLTLVLVVGLLAACGNSSSSSTDTSSKASSETQESTSTPESASETTPADTTGETVKIWVAEEVKSFTEEQAAAFIAANPEYAGYTVVVEAVGEGDAASNMITDVEGGADIFGFAQDQLARLVSAGALSPVMGENADWVVAENDTGASGAATLGDYIWAYPLTSDNGYFLYYDSTVISDPSTLEGILADCEAAGKSFYMDIRSGWYNTAFFFGTGCTLTYETNDEGGFTVCNTDYASEKGLAALKAIVTLSKSSAFVNGSSFGDATNPAAVVDGTWDKESAQQAFGDGYACAKLPTFNVDGKDYQMSGFGGFKLLGVKPQTDATKLAFLNALAKYLSSEEVQLARFELKGWGPSNKNAQQNAAVQSDEALAALADQLQYTIAQGQYPNDYWMLSEALGDDIIGKKLDNASDEELMAVLEDFQNSCIGYANAQ